MSIYHILYFTFHFRTSVTVIELLAAVCLVKGGHIKIIEAVDNFKRENGEQHRFEKLVEYFMDPNASAEFQGACMNFINVIVHSAEDMNFRIHLQHEFSLLGLDEYIEVSLGNLKQLKLLALLIVVFESISKHFSKSSKSGVCIYAKLLCGG